MPLKGFTIIFKASAVFGSRSSIWFIIVIASAWGTMFFGLNVPPG